MTESSQDLRQTENQLHMIYFFKIRFNLINIFPILQARFMPVGKEGKYSWIGAARSRNIASDFLKEPKSIKRARTQMAFHAVKNMHLSPLLRGLLLSGEWWVRRLAG